MKLNNLNKKQLSGIFILLIVLIGFNLYPKKQKTPLIETSTKGKVLSNKPNNISLLAKSSITSEAIFHPTNTPVIHSYKGSKPDGSVNIDTNGLIIIDQDLKRLFDYFISAAGELSVAEIKNQLKLFAQKNLDSFQLAELMTFFDQYSKFLTAYDSFALSISPELSQQQRLAYISEFRVAKLGVEMANVFFADEENYIAFVLSDKLGVDGQLSEQQVAWLESENKATEYLDTIEENDLFNESESINTNEIYEYRVQQYGEQAALRLTQLDINRSQWQQTLSDYNAQRQLIENDQSNMTLIQLHTQYSEQQVRRLNGLWRVRHD